MFVRVQSDLDMAAFCRPGSSYGTIEDPNKYGSISRVL